jgi:hypothetical protein
MVRRIARLVICAWLVVSAGHVAFDPARARTQVREAPDGVTAQTPSAIPTARVGTMSELMVHLIYPTSDAVFYISSRTPKTDAEWAELQAKTLTLAESANLLMMPGRARDQDRWMKDARLMLDAGWAAFKAAKAKDVAALESLSDQLYESCVTCHKNYRPDYGKPKPPPL